ncbi:MAG: MlaA family lipoprotein, partial [Legionellales bacterium]
YSPYAYINDSVVVYSLLGFRYVDLRSQFLNSEPLMAQALDQYTFYRDAYLQHRNYLISGAEQDNGSLYVDDTKAEQSAIDYVDE